MTTIDTFENEELSDIQKFYKGACIFVTGGTGFLGNILLEKLLRTCCNIKKIYVLVREKKGKETSERFKALFDDVIFDEMKKVCPNFLEKVSPIVGDCLKPYLGLSEADRNTIIEEANIIIHAAATVRFDAHLRYAVKINIQATRDLLELAHQVKNLKAYVHVSTAYSNCAGRREVEEKFYEPPISPDSLINMVEALTDDMITRITPELLKPWPNSYSFTKAIAEDVVRNKGKNLPVIVFRPAIVIATSKEPVAGWINNFYGPTGVVAGAGLGLLRSMHANGECIADIVPCDNVVNGIIAAAWEVGTTWKSTEEKVVKEIENEENTKKDVEDDQIPILNYVSCNASPLKWKDFMKYNEEFGQNYPSVLAIWVYCLTLNKYKTVHEIYCIFLHLLPALIVDTTAKMLGKEPKLWDAYQKIHKFSEVISYFSTKQWKFVDNNVMKLCDKLSEKDKDLFNFDLRKLDWVEYFKHHIKGLRVYLVHDSLDTLPEAKIRNQRCDESQISNFKFGVLNF